MSAAYPVLDVTDWSPAGEEQLGTKPKQWLIHPETDERWLWKASTWNVARGGVRYRKGDDWSERVVRAVGEALGLPVAEVELAVRGDDVGVVSRRFLSAGESLTHGNELLPAVGDPRNRTGYTPEAVASVLRSVGAPDVSPGLVSAMDWFSGYLVLDALVGNTDRHIENWGVLTVDGDRRLSPSFDHASSFGFLLGDDERRERLTTSDVQRSLAAYARRSPSKFAGSPHPIDVACTSIDLVPRAVANHWLDRVAALPSVEPFLDAVPDERLTDVAREFAARLYVENHTTLSHRLRSLTS